MNPEIKKLVITTSWDDGHPSDIRLVDLLAEYSIPATLYIPRTSQRPVLSEVEIRRLSKDCEIGAHTMTHCDLRALSPQDAHAEIADSKDWVEQITGRPCKTFCFPGGRFRANHLKSVIEAGYRGCRTVELLSISEPEDHGVMTMGTTVQAFPHLRSTYLRNCVKRGNLLSAARWRALAACRSGDWVSLLSRVLQEAGEAGGVFHLWGHSWELDRQWEALASALAVLREYSGRAGMLTNGELCESAARSN